MKDREFIIFLCEQIQNITNGGWEADFDTIEKELKDRSIDPDEIFLY